MQLAGVHLIYKAHRQAEICYAHKRFSRLTNIQIIGAFNNVSSKQQNGTGVLGSEVKYAFTWHAN